MTSRLTSIVRLSTRRVRSGFGLFLAGVIASAALVGLWVGIPLYAESATAALLNEQVGESEGDNLPFGYLFSFNRLSGGSRSWSDIEPVNNYLAEGDTPFGSSVGETRRFVQTVSFDAYLAEDVDGERFGRLGFGSVNILDTDIDIRAGRLPEATTGGVVEAVLSEERANELGLSPGQQLRIEGAGVAGGQSPASVLVEIVGTWTSDRQTPQARFARSGTMRESLVISEAAMASELTDLGDEIISNTQWLVLLDAAMVTTDNVDALLARTDDINRAVDDRLSGTRLLISPEASLVGFQDQVVRLNNGLALFSIPTLALVIFVVGLVAAMAWTARLSDVDLLRHRGVSSNVVVGGAIVEAAATTVVAAAVGLGASFGVAGLMARTSTFLQLGDSVDLTLTFTSRAQRSLIAVALVVFVVHVVPSLTTYRWSHRVGLRRAETRVGVPVWQRHYLDLAVIAATIGFGWFVLRSSSLQNDLLDDPVVILLPAAIAVAIGLAVLRVLPFTLAWVSRLVERTNSTALLLVLRRAARTPGPLAAPLMLLIVTGALSVYTASLARTLDLQLLDEAHHWVGGANSILDDPAGDGTLFELIDGRPVISRGATGPPIDASAYERVWGLAATTRLAQLPGRAEGIGGGAPIPIEITAIDPETFGDAAFWRADYASRDLPDLLATLKATPDGVLIGRRALAANDLRIGDVIDISATAGERGIDVPMVIVGSFDQFPTWSPSNPLTPAVVSLGDMEARLGTSLARRVIFTRDDGAVDDAQTRADLNRLGINGSRVESAADRIADAQVRPERQGIFGLLTVSFVLSTTLTLAAFVFYASFGFRQQLTEVGVLRAVGLPLRSLFVLVGCDLLLVALVGTGVAVAAGAAMATVLLPRLIGTSSGGAPVLLPEVDWVATGVISGILLVGFVAVTALLLVGLRRIRLFEAVKLGALR